MIEKSGAPEAVMRDVCPLSSAWEQRRVMFFSVGHSHLPHRPYSGNRQNLHTSKL